MGWFDRALAKARKYKILTKSRLFILSFVPLAIYVGNSLINPTAISYLTLSGFVYVFIADMVALLYYVLKDCEVAGVISMCLSYVLISYLWALLWAGLYSVPPPSGIGSIIVVIVVIVLALLYILLSLASIIFYYTPLVVTILEYHGDMGKYEPARKALIYILIVFVSLHYTWFFLDYFDFLMNAGRTLFFMIAPPIYVVLVTLIFIWLVTLFFYFKEGYGPLVAGLAYSVFLRCHVIALFLALVSRTNAPVEFWYRGFLMLFYVEVIIGIILILASLGPKLIRSVAKAKSH